MLLEPRTHTFDATDDVLPDHVQYVLQQHLWPKALADLDLPLDILSGCYADVRPLPQWVDRPSLCWARTTIHNCNMHVFRQIWEYCLKHCYATKGLDLDSECGGMALMHAPGPCLALHTACTLVEVRAFCRR